MKRIKRILFKIFSMESVNERFKQEPSSFESIGSADPKKLFIFVLAFNQHELIPLHAAALRKFLKGDYEYFVMDNSNNNEESIKIKEYCLTNHINYIRIPKNPGPDPSINAGMALNWTFHNIVERFKPQRFGIIDSDMFPVEAININVYLDKGDAWGIITDREPNIFGKPPATVWYLWLGLWFFRRSWFNGGEPNFLPDWGVDSGGRIRIDPSLVKVLPDVCRLQEPELMEISPGVIIHRYGKFIHFSASSFNPKAMAEKKEWLEDLLKNNL